MSRIQRLLGHPGKYSVAPALVFLALATGAALYAFEPAPTPAPRPVPAPQSAPVPIPAPEPKPAPRPQADLAQREPPQPPMPEEMRRAVEARIRSELQKPYDKWTREEVVWISTPAEIDAFNRLETDDERNQFIEQFWLRRDPTPDTPVNEYREEHYRRMAWSNDRFSFDGRNGWRTSRGMVYIKFGPADEREEHPNDSPRTEKWKYRFIEGLGSDVIVNFVDDAGDGAYQVIWDVEEALRHTEVRPWLDQYQRIQWFYEIRRPGQVQ